MVTPTYRDMLSMTAVELKFLGNTAAGTAMSCLLTIITALLHEHNVDPDSTLPDVLTYVSRTEESLDN